MIFCHANPIVGASRRAIRRTGPPHCRRGRAGHPHCGAAGAYAIELVRPEGRQSAGSDHRRHDRPEPARPWRSRAATSTSLGHPARMRVRVRARCAVPGFTAESLHLRLAMFGEAQATNSSYSPPATAPTTSSRTFVNPAIAASSTSNPAVGYDNQHGNSDEVMTPCAPRRLPGRQHPGSMNAANAMHHRAQGAREIVPSSGRGIRRGPSAR